MVDLNAWAIIFLRRDYHGRKENCSEEQLTRKNKIIYEKLKRDRPSRIVFHIFIKYTSYKFNTKICWN
jgi:hypothetical protein